MTDHAPAPQGGQYVTGKMWRCPNCGFAFGAEHTTDGTDRYDCPICETQKQGRLPETKPDYDWLVQQIRSYTGGLGLGEDFEPGMAQHLLGNLLQREEGLIHELVAALRAVDQNMDEDTRASDLWLKVITALARAKEMRV